MTYASRCSQLAEMLLLIMANFDIRANALPPAQQTSSWDGFWESFMAGVYGKLVRHEAMGQIFTEKQVRADILNRVRKMQV